MPASPDISGSVGGDATDKAIAAAKQAQLNAIRAETKLIEQRVARAQVKASGPMPGGHSEESKARAIQSRIDDVQAEHQKKAAESTEKFSLAVGTATTVLGVLAHAASAINSAQSDASAKTNDARIRRAQAMRDLGYSPADVKSSQDRAESGVALPGNVTPDQEVQLLEAAAAARSNAHLPASLSPRGQIKDIIGSDTSFQEKLAALQNPLVPGVEFAMRGQGRTGMEATAGKAAAAEAGLAAGQASSEADAAAAGQRTRERQQEIDNMVRSGGVSGVAATANGIPVVGSLLSGAEMWLMKIYDKLPGQTPPSSNGGRP